MQSYFNVLQEDDFEEIDGNEEVVEEKTSTSPTTAIIQELEDGEIVEDTAATLSKKQPYSIDIQFKFEDSYSEEELNKEFDQTWVLWFDSKKKDKSNSKEQEYLQNVKKIGSFNSLKGLKQLWNGLSSSLDSNISIFKEGIEPAWEDVKNKDGGKYSINYMKESVEFSKVLSSWFTLFTTIVYATQWENYTQTNGIVLSIRNWGSSINLWNSESENQNNVQSLKEALQNLLKVKYAKYSSHNTTILLKTFKKNDEKKKKTYKVFGNQSYVVPSNGGGFDEHKSGETKITWMSNLNNQMNNNNNNNNNIARKGKQMFIVSSSNPEDKLKRSFEQEEQQQQQQQQQVQPQQLQSQPLQQQIPVIPSGVNAWSTGILLGKDPAPLVTPHVAVDYELQQEEQQEDAVVPQLQQQSNVVVEQQQQEEVSKTTSTVNKPHVNAWSTGLLLPKSEEKKVEPTNTSAWSSKPPIVNNNKNEQSPDVKPTSPVVSNEELEEGEIVEEKKEVKREKKEKPINNQEKKEKKEKKEKVDKKNHVDEAAKNEKFWEEDKKKKQEEQAALDLELPALPSKPPAPKQRLTYEQKRALKNVKPVVSLWEKGDLLKLMSETQPSAETVNTEAIESPIVNSVSTVVEQPSFERVTISIKPTDKKLLVEVAPKTDEWIQVESKSHSRSLNKEEEGNQSPSTSTETDNNNATTSTQQTEIKKKKKEKPVSTIREPTANKILLMNLEVEEPLEYKTPIKQEKKKPIINTKKPIQPKQSLNSKSTTSTSTTTSSTTVTTTKSTTKSSNTTATTTKKSNKNASLLSPSLMMNLGALIVVLLIGFLLKYLFSN